MNRKYQESGITIKLCSTMANKLKESKSKGEVLVRRGCPTPISPVLERAKQNDLKKSRCEIVQCDSGFCDDFELRLSEAQSSEPIGCASHEIERENIKTLEERTRNLRIDSRDTEAAANHQLLFDINNPERTEVDPVEGDFLQGHYATSSDKRYLLADLWEKVFSQNEDGDTALHIAVIHGQYKEVDFIISISPCSKCLDIFNDLRQTPLHLAVITKKPFIVCKLLLAGANIDLRDRNGKTALHLACERGDKLCVQEITRPLLEKGSYSDDMREKLQDMLDARDYQGFTALHLAVKSNSQSVVEHLALIIGADINCQDGTSGRSPLHVAVELNNLGLVNYLLFHCKAFVNSVMFDGCTPLHVAAGVGLENHVAILLAAGADPNADNYEGITPQEYATDEVFEMLEL